MDTVHDELDENERVLTRSRSVPPELEASPHSFDTSLPSLDTPPPLQEESPPAPADSTERSGSELPVLPSNQSTSSSWVRWWSRSRDIHFDAVSA